MLNIALQGLFETSSHWVQLFIWGPPLVQFIIPQKPSITLSPISLLGTSLIKTTFNPKSLGTYPMSSSGLLSFFRTSSLQPAKTAIKATIHLDFIYGMFHSTLATTKFFNSYNKSQRDALFLKFILIKNPICSGKIYRPSSGVSTLYTQQ